MNTRNITLYKYVQQECKVVADDNDLHFFLKLPKVVIADMPYPNLRLLLYNNETAGFIL